MIKKIKFRPLRIIKKTGKITVANYMQWRKVKTADYNQFQLIVVDEYRHMNPDAFVYDHEGQQLFWFNHPDPSEIPRAYPDINAAVFMLGMPEQFFDGEMWRFEKPIGEGFAPHIRGFDVDGIPTFSHCTALYAATHYTDMSQFVPLTVKTVTHWVGWFLYNLNNSKLQIGTSQ